MKKHSLLIIGILLFNVAASQSWLWGKSAPDSLHFDNVKVDRLNNTVATTIPVGEGPGKFKTNILKYDEYGNELWRKTVHFQASLYYSYYYPMYHTVDHYGNIYLVCPTVRSYQGVDFPYDSAKKWNVIKLDPNGNLDWRKKISPPGSIPLKIQADSNKIYLASAVSVTGSLEVFDSSYTVPPGMVASNYLSKFDTSGRIEWTKLLHLHGLATMHFYNLDFHIYGNHQLVLDLPISDSIRSSFIAPQVSLNRSGSAFGRYLIVLREDGTQVYSNKIQLADYDDKVRAAYFNDGRSVWLLKPLTHRQLISGDSILFLDASGNLYRKTGIDVPAGADFYTDDILAKEGHFIISGDLVTGRYNPEGSYYKQIRKYDTANQLLWQKNFPALLSRSLPYELKYNLSFNKNYIAATATVKPMSNSNPVSFGNSSIEYKNGFYSFIVAIKDFSNTVSGQVYYDENNNNQFDSGELPAAFRPIQISNNSFVFTDNEGRYLFGAPAGPISDTLKPVPYYIAAPVAYSYNFSATDSSIINQDFRLTPASAVNDLSVWIMPVTAASFSRPSYLRLYYKNSGTTILSGSVSLKLSPYARYTSSSFTPVHTSIDSVAWDFTNLKPGQERMIAVQLSYLTGPLNTLITTTADIKPFQADSTQQDNIHSVVQLLRGSYDPNDKLCNPVDTLSRLRVSTGKEWIDYVIQFQNTGTDTASRVVVVDKLSALLDRTSLEIKSATHNFISTLKGDVLQFEFPDIDLPDSNVNKAASQGAIYFRIKPKSTLANGDTIKNSASIYFDFNEPVVTNTTSNYFKQTSTTAIVVVRGENRELNVFPNPVVKNELHFNLLGERITGRYNLRVIDMNGRVVQSSVVNVNGALNRISTVNLHAGVYLVEVYNDKRKFVASFVKR